MQPDNELLQQYARARSEDAFAELVRRHVNLVYSAALRQVAGDAHLARDAAQNVFTDLARKAASLSRRESLTGWLYTSAYFAANKIVRTENRRRQREEQFMREPAHDTPDTNWEQLRPALDAVMHELNETDREAVLLRYFENRAFAEVGAKLNLNENAARMRVDRALEKLRTLLAKRGITTGAALAAVISANAVQTAPGTLALTLASASLAGASAGSFTLLQTMNALKFKIGAGALIIATAAIVFTTSRNTHATPRVQNTQPAEQIAPSEMAEDTSLTPPPTNDTLASTRPIQSVKLVNETGQINAKNVTDPAGLQTTNAEPQTNKAIVKLEIKLVTISADKLPTLRPAWPGGDSGTLTVDQFKFIGEAIEHMGKYSSTQTRITTFNGREAIMGSKTPVLASGDTNASVDTLFGVTPYFSPQSSTFRLDLFLGLHPPGADSSAPDYQMFGQTNEINLSFNQIAVLQKEIPTALLPADGSTGGAKMLLVFVAPELGGPDQETQPETPDDKTARLNATTAKEGVLGLIMFASDNQGQIPPTLTQTASYFKDGGEENVETNFDLIYSGSISSITNPSQIILLKEKQPWQATNGAWMKAYGFADGHAEIRREANGDFDKFEKEHTSPPEN